ncbi:hypothetical protein McanMca71_000619 [Microsporum canis]|uniref:BZIP domain-containing protein n=1 Tax=Arthroderma otae (strain ATCC MYA-4605 / CBS 113480) TaxID=554155 RepID=C5FLX0_ARTOC|nr:conserved hypothetical protein [Microsporum canis CBS 113480]EEQ30692.1 conserved hypothetical protein [Microsporum canis CBS 113480]
MNKRKADDIVVPDIAEDAAERKRVLNVLAQRRYRQRKREQLAELKAKAKHAKSKAPESIEHAASPRFESSQNQEPVNLPVVVEEQVPTPPEIDYEIPPTFDGVPSSFGDIFNPHGNPVETDGESALLGLDSMPEFNFDTSFLSAMGIETPPLDLPSPPSDDHLMPSSRTSPSLSMLSLQFLANQPQDDTQPLSSALQSFQSSNFTFPDDKILDVPPLTLLRAMLTIATRLNLTDHIWNITGISPFYTGSTDIDVNGAQPRLSLNLEDIPKNFQPTPTQRLVPHHALLDLLPWPSARDKLIQVFSLPVQLRPPAAADPMGLMGLVYDIEDAGEGLRVSGPDPFSSEMWEVGQLVFQRWWWAFEGSIVERSNRLRSERGEQGLILGDVP